MPNNNNKYELAKAIAKKKARLLKHVFIFIGVNVFLAIINNITAPGYQWWLWFVLLWGIALIIHFVVTLSKGRLKTLEYRIMQKELGKVNADNGIEMGSDITNEMTKTEKSDEEIKDEGLDIEGISTKEKLILANVLKNKGKRRIIFGLLWIIGGLIAVLIQYATAEPGERVFIFFGAFVVGIILLIKGIKDNSKGNEIINDLAAKSK